MDIQVRALEWDAWNVDHVARNGIMRSDVEDVCLGHRKAEAGYGGRLRVVGRAPSGKIVVTNLEPLGDGLFYCVTAFPATGRARRRFLERERGGSA